MTKNELQELLNKLSKNIIKDLEENYIIPDNGFIAGGAAASLIFKHLKLPISAPINDIDIFKNVIATNQYNKNNEELFKKHQIFLKNSSYDEKNKEIETKFQNQALKFENIYNKNYLNIIEYSTNNKENNKFNNIIILNSFDINMVQVGIDINTKEIYFTDNFFDFITNGFNLKITNNISPFKSYYRVVKKSKECNGINFHLDKIEKQSITSQAIIKKLSLEKIFNINYSEENFNKIQKILPKYKMKLNGSNYQLDDEMYDNVDPDFISYVEKIHKSINNDAYISLLILHSFDHLYNSYYDINQRNKIIKETENKKDFELFFEINSIINPNEINFNLIDIRKEYIPYLFSYTYNNNLFNNEINMFVEKFKKLPKLLQYNLLSFDTLNDYNIDKIIKNKDFFLNYIQNDFKKTIQYLIDQEETDTHYIYELLIDFDINDPNVFISNKANIKNILKLLNNEQKTNIFEKLITPNKNKSIEKTDIAHLIFGKINKKKFLMDYITLKFDIFSNIDDDFIQLNSEQQINFLNMEIYYRKNMDDVIKNDNLAKYFCEFLDNYTHNLNENDKKDVYKELNTNPSSHLNEKILNDKKMKYKFLIVKIFDFCNFKNNSNIINILAKNNFIKDALNYLFVDDKFILEGHFFYKKEELRNNLLNLKLKIELNELGYTSKKRKM